MRNGEPLATATHLSNLSQPRCHRRTLFFSQSSTTATGAAPLRTTTVATFNAGFVLLEFPNCLEVEFRQFVNSWAFEFGANWVQAGALIKVYSDGTVLVTHGDVEMRQGLCSKIALVAIGLVLFVLTIFLKPFP